MLTMTEYYVVISDSEMGPECHDIVSKYRNRGDVVDLARDTFRITVPTAEHQEQLYTSFKVAMKRDFPQS